MEEDIKRLKVLLIHAENTLLDEEAIALEHLIKAYKELKDEIDILMGQNEWYKDCYDCESVSKSKIEELKHELEEEYISLGKNKTEQSTNAMLGLEFAIDKISKLLEGK